MIRAVIDTNVFVSAVLGGRLALLLDLWDAQQFVLVVSDEIVREYVEVLHRPKLGLRPGQIDRVVALVIQAAEFAAPADLTFAIAADPDDNKFLDAAIAGGADYLVSGDHHLLDLRQYQAIRIITAREFITLPELQSSSKPSATE